jgi:hypothetical protein
MNVFSFLSGRERRRRTDGEEGSIPSILGSKLVRYFGQLVRGLPATSMRQREFLCQVPTLGSDFNSGAEMGVSD